MRISNSSLPLLRTVINCCELSLLYVVTLIVIAKLMHESNAAVAHQVAWRSCLDEMFISKLQAQPVAVTSIDGALDTVLTPSRLTPVVSTACSCR